MLRIPTTASRSFRTLPRNITRKMPRNTSLHCLLTLDLALDKSTDFTTWKTMFPSMDSFEASVPLLWPTTLQDLLPKPAMDLLRKQQKKIEHDWGVISQKFPDVNKQEYLYFWLLVNSRSFYYSDRRMERFPHWDRLSLVPIADMFNHADTGSEPEFTTEYFTLIADRAYREGEEVYTCYGSHSNDFLLAEYGFIMAENRWDTVLLDDVILPELSEDQKADLSDSGYLGKYTLDAETNICYRTQVALWRMCCTPQHWKQVVDANIDGDLFQEEMNSLLVKLLRKFSDVARKKLAELSAMEIGQKSQRELLTERWKQIHRLITLAMNRLKRK